ncbi:UNVERIFIED_CONTAM: sporulation and spore germination protein [Acetivibrio alkalicellulosi]
MRKLLCIFLVCIMIITFMSGCSSDKQSLVEDEVFPASSILLSEAEASKISDKVPIHLYFANEDYTKLKLEIRYIPISEAKKSVNHLAEIIVNELIKGPKVSGLKPTIPVEAKLHEDIKIDGDVAIVDFNSEFRDKHPGGKAQEKMTIYSIVNSLTELKEINKVKFLIDGESAKEFKGNFRFNSAFPRTMSLISMEIQTSVRDTDEDADNKNDKDKESKDTSSEFDFIIEEEDVFIDMKEDSGIESFIDVEE